MFVQLRKKSVRMLILAILSLSMVPSASAEVLNQDSAPGSLTESAVQVVAEANGLAREDLEVVYNSTVNYGLQGITANALKVLDHKSDEIYSVLLDANGNVLDQAALEKQQAEAYQSLYGRLHPDLAAQIASDKEAKPIDVIIWLKEAGYTAPERPEPVVYPLVLSGQDSAKEAAAREGDAQQALPESAEQPAGPSFQEAYLTQVDAQRAEAVASVVAPVMSRLTDMGLQVTGDQYAPIVYASLSPAQIREVAAWSEVDMVYPNQQNADALDIARRTIYADVVNGRGYTGAGVRSAVIEVGGRIATANPYLAGTTQDTTYSCLNWHTTHVAGIVRSTHATVRGVAPGTTLWVGGSCGGWDNELQNRSTAAVNWGARVFNLSWGRDVDRVPGANDRYYDNMVINNYRSVMVAAGNRGTTGCTQGTDGDVISPALAYNVVTVGNFDDKGSIAWAGDTMASCSSWRDPISTAGDREKPEIAAPGTNINSTSNASPWVGTIASGTSMASPMVAGTAALLMQRNSSLTAWPEGVKAILMASAAHNVEGASRLSEYDGAGGLVSDWADDIARGYNGNWGARSYTCSTTTPLDVATISLTAGVRTRVAIAWDTDPAYASYASRPGADLDLRVLNSAGTTMASSLSYDNTYEIVEFTPSSSGAYRIRVNRVRCDYNPRYLGWAWRIG